MKGKMKHLLILFLLGISIQASAQFAKKMEFAGKAGLLMTNEKIIYQDYGQGLDIGQYPLFTSHLDIWYNVNRSVSVGLNFNFTSNDFTTYNFENEEFEDAFIYYYSIGGGLGVKYYFVNLKKLKVFVKGNLQYNVHDIYYGTPILVNIGDYPFETKYFVSEYGDYDNTLEFGLGGEITLGMKAYFSKSFGFVLEPGYFTNAFYSGFFISGGFFIDLFEK